MCDVGIAAARERKELMAGERRPPAWTDPGVREGDVSRGGGWVPGKKDDASSTKVKDPEQSRESLMTCS